MMRPSFEDLVRLTGSDGASVVNRVPSTKPKPEVEVDADVQAVMGAWSIERERAVEAELILVKALDFLERKVRANRMLSDSDRREAQKLIRAIRFRLDARD